MGWALALASLPRVKMPRNFILMALLLGVSCGRGPALPLENEPWSPDNECGPDPDRCVSEVTLHRAADILFVIDDSGSMAKEQNTLARNFPAFVDVLEGEGLELSYRVGVVNTSLGPLRATSCRERTEEFFWNRGYSDEIDAREEGCLDVCRLGDFEVEPSPLDTDSTRRRRPWLESSPDGDNLPRGVTMTEAFECVGPQGISGDGYEAPLETMFRVIADDDTGFLRDDAVFAVIFVTDEEDCSMPEANSRALKSGEPFTTPLWTTERPTSAVCWTAGVRCEGGPDVFSTCYAENIDFSRQPTTPENAVLHPVDRYVQALRELSNRKQRMGGNGTVLVAVIAGVPLDYQQGASIVYRNSDNPIFNLEYGIGPGCGRGTESRLDPPGLPPVRLREFAESFATDQRNLYSVCSSDYSIALRHIASEIGRLGSRACVPGCARDTDAAIAGLQPSCEVYEERASGRRVRVRPCAITNQGWFFPDDEDLCYRALVDRDGSTAFTHDDMSPQCVTRGSNVEIVLERREELEDELGTVRVDCQTTSRSADQGC